MKSFILRWRLVLVLVAVLVAVTAFASANPAEAAIERIPFDNINVNCVILSQNMWVENGILHIRERVMNGVVESDGDHHEGTTRMVANANIDMATGYGDYWGLLTIYPYAYPDGFWDGKWVMQVNEGGAGGFARLKGYGVLNGSISKSLLTPLTPADLANYAYLCGGNQPISGAHAVGFMTRPDGG
jgi:hypothetical protein